MIMLACGKRGFEGDGNFVSTHTDVEIRICHAAVAVWSPMSTSTDKIIRHGRTAATKEQPICVVSVRWRCRDDVFRNDWMFLVPPRARAGHVRRLVRTLAALLY